MKGQNIGMACSLLMQYIRLVDKEWYMLEKIDGIDCANQLRRAQLRGMRIVRKRICAMTNMKYTNFLKEVERRTSSRWVYFNLHSVLGD